MWSWACYKDGDGSSARVLRVAKVVKGNGKIPNRFLHTTEIA